MPRLRAAKLADAQAIVDLDQRIFGAYGAQESAAVIQARLTVFAAGCVVLVTGDPEELVGYLTTEKWMEWRTPALDQDPNTTHSDKGGVLNITTLAIAPSWQGKALGKRLVECAIELARREGCGEIVLETAHAERFYRRQGFELIERREERGILMSIMALTL